jgi:hypothetical protein
MAEHVAKMLVEGTMVVGTEKRRGQGHGRRNGAYGLIAAVLVAAVIGGSALHDRGASHPAATAIPRTVTRAQVKFLEDNTTNLPNAVSVDVRPIVTSNGQKYLDVNTTWLPNVAASPVMPSGERRFLEVNTVLPVGPSYPYAEDVTPLPGHRR